MNNQGKHSVADVAKRHFDINSLLMRPVTQETNTRDNAPDTGDALDTEFLSMEEVVIVNDSKVGSDGYLAIGAAPRPGFTPADITDIIPFDPDPVLSSQVLLEVDFTADELVEEYMAETIHTAESLKALIPKPKVRIEITDDFAHQLIVPKCNISYAVTLLRLLEEDIYTFERIGKGIETHVTVNAVRIWGSKLNALAHTHHRKLIETIQLIIRDGALPEFMAALDRMNYQNWFDGDRNELGLRCRNHVRYGHIAV